MRLFFSLLLSLGIASSASAVTMDWSFVGNPGNAADSTGFGAVPYVYSIGTYEVTNAQYTEFLNAKAATDPFGLYNAGMGDSGFGGIARSDVSGSYTYNVVPGVEDWPVNFVSALDALRFANWMNNGQGNGDTETGAYTLTLGPDDDLSTITVSRNPGAAIGVASEDEWYKAAYYDAVTASYFDYPTGSNTRPLCESPTAVPNRANCGNHMGTLASVGSYIGSASPYGTFDQGGNVAEWTDTLDLGTGVVRGGHFNIGVPPATSRSDPSFIRENRDTGFRLAMTPEPGTGLLVIAGLLGLTGWRRVRA